MSTTTTLAPVFVKAAAAADAKAQLLKEQAEANKAAKEKADRQARLDQRNAAGRPQKDIGFLLGVGNRFLDAVAEYGENEWTGTEIKQAGLYAQELVRQSDVELPPISDELAAVVHGKFAYGMVLAGKNVPEDFFVGQRQDWYPELFTDKKAERVARATNGAKPSRQPNKPSSQGKPARVFTTTSSV